MKRRDFLKAGSSVSIPLMLNGFGLRAIPRNMLAGPMGQSDKVLVLVQLNGGNDGLNTIIPLERYSQLSKVRSNILIPESKVILVEDGIGFHPNMQGLKEVYDNGRLGVIRGVAYPNQNRSHFRSTDIWTTGSSADEFKTTGWLGDYFSMQYPDYPDNYPNPEHPDPFALTIGSIVSETCQGLGSNFSLAMTDPFNLSPLPEGATGSIPPTNYGSELAFLLEAIKQTNAYAETITEAANKGSNLSTLYPGNNRLAQQLKTVALLIAGGLKTNVYVVTIGGFDTHANQTDATDPTLGEHAELMQQVSDAIHAFQDDLEKLGVDERVLGMTFSEFGRQIASNDSFGTDHGTAAPLILFGSCIEPGFLGQNPEIGDEVMPQEGVAMQYDFRSVYASVLMDWFGISQEQVEEIFFDGVQHLPVIAGCATTSVFDDAELVTDLKVFPNPVTRQLTIEAGLSQGTYRISLFDHLGHELRVIASQRFSTGTHRLLVPLDDLPAGSYFVHLTGSTVQQVRKVIKF